jgi:hypothetical protein
LAEGLKIAGHANANLRDSYTDHKTHLAPEALKLEMGIDNLNQDRSITVIKAGNSAPLNLYIDNAQWTLFVMLSAVF